MAGRFENALADAGLEFRSDLYRGGKLSWRQRDIPVTYDEAPAEPHRCELLAPFDPRSARKAPNAGPK